ADDIRAQHAKMSQIIRAQDHVGRPGGLEQRIDTSCPVFRKLVFVGINEVKLRILIQSLDHLKKGEGGQCIIVVEQADEFAAAHRETLVRIAGDAEIRVQELNLDTAVGSGESRDAVAILLRARVGMD